MQELAKVWIEGAKGVGQKTTPENWDTHTLQWQCTLEGHKGEIANIGTGPVTIACVLLVHACAFGAAQKSIPLETVYRWA